MFLLGLVRKALSIMTLGLIPYRSKKAQIARNTRRTAKYAKRNAGL